MFSVCGGSAHFASPAVVLDQDCHSDWLGLTIHPPASLLRLKKG